MRVFRMLDETSIALAELPAPLALGRSAEIYPWRDGRVLKLFLRDCRREDILQELSNTRAVSRTGINAASCHGTVEIDGRIGIILDRIDGPSLTKLPESRAGEFFSVPRYLADVHLQIHNEKCPQLQDIRERLISNLDLESLSFLSREEKESIRKYVSSLPAGDRVIHLDFHTENIICAANGRFVIDWMTAAKGHPAMDVAFTYYLMKDAELFPGISLWQKIFYETVRQYILSKYLKRYFRVSGLSRVDLEPWRLPVLLFRLGLWNIESERPRLQFWIRQELQGIPKG